jgi:hypothetical protein
MDRSFLVNFNLVLLMVFLGACLPTGERHLQISLKKNFPEFNDKLYSLKGVERVVSFKALYRTNYTSLADFQNSSGPTKWELAKTVKFLFGPLVERQVGGPQRGENIKVYRQQALMMNGFVHVPYDYQALWLMDREFSQSEQVLPVPYQSNMRTSAQWKRCGDPDPEHQTDDFFWYFWDPRRPGCDQKEGIDYQNVSLNFSEETLQTKTSYPEYQRMVRFESGKKVLSATFAFGYVEDSENPQPMTDWDAGMYEFQKFLKYLRVQLQERDYQEAPIFQSEYDGRSDLQIGSEFTIQQGDVELRFRVVAAAGVDQMLLFAKSYAEDHEALFSWFGHSRVGSGFDAQNFQYIVEGNPQKYKISSDYQVIYWAGCNSYSYYTQAFFEMKSKLNPSRDPEGTKNLDIISNGLPSYFSMNSRNAEIVSQALLNFNQPTSYQSLVDEIELASSNWMGNLVLVNVLGDEDNL